MHACLRAGKKVLVEKPVLQWPSVRAAAETACGWVHVGFQRRRDTEYMRAKRHCERHRVSSAVFLAEDPWDAEQDTEADARTLCGVLRNSLCHEFDLLHWLWPGGHVALLRVEGRPQSGAFVAGAVRHADGGGETHFEIRFSKGHPTHYAQLLTLDGRPFGYPRFPTPGGFDEAGGLYEAAFVEQERDHLRARDLRT